MVEAGMQPAEVMRVSGHTTPAMLWRYLNTNVDIARRAADALDMLRNSISSNDAPGPIHSSAAESRR
jgi:hypothetical protein